MHRNPYSNQSPALRRPGLLRALAFLLLAGLLWSWGQVQAAPAWAATSEPVFAAFDSEAQVAEDAAASQDGQRACAKPSSTQASGVELVLNEIADQEALSRLLLGGALSQALPPQGAQPLLQQAWRQPLLRPPRRLG